MTSRSRTVPGRRRPGTVAFTASNVAGNPRIDDLRKRIEKEPGSRLFAQLAEELRKDGELEDAIRVAREGLQRHPNYPSARMTLGRALLDTGDWAAARTEFELVLKSAADNILASRYLGECLESLGDREGAIARYKATLLMAPGEKHVLARLQGLEKGATAAAPPAAKGGRATRRPRDTSRHGAPSGNGHGCAGPVGPAVRPAPPPPPAVAPPPPAAAAPPPPIPLSTVEGEMELETSGHAQEPPAPAPAPASASPGAPIPLVDADEDFEIERPYESPTTSVGRSESAAAPAPPAAAPAPEAEGAEEHEFELEAPHEAPSTGWAASIRPLPVVEEPPPEMANWPPPAAVTPPPPAAPPAAEKPAPPAAPAAGPSTLTSPTLGELYFNQGFTDKAIEVYRELSAREPGNERLAARLRELEKLQRALGGGEPAAAPASGAAARPRLRRLEPRTARRPTAGRRSSVRSSVSRGFSPRFERGDGWPHSPKRSRASHAACRRPSS